MTNMKLILFDGTEVPVESFGLPMHAVVHCADADGMMDVWNQLTPMNLSRVEVKQNDVTVYAFTGGKVDGQQSVVNPDGSLTVHFYMSGVRQEVVDDTTQEYVTAAQIMMGEAE